VAAVALTAVLVRVVLHQVWQLDMPLGTDPALWGLSILDALHHLPPLLPPLFGLSGVPLVAAGLPVEVAARAVSLGADGLTVLAVHALAAEAGLSRAPRLLAAALVAVHPDLVLSAQLTQPEALTALSLTLAGLGVALVARRASPGRILLAALLLALPLLARMQGLIVSLVGVSSLVLAAAAAQQGRPRARSLRALLALLACVLSLQLPLLGLSGHLWGRPADLPWAGRMAAVQEDIQSLALGARVPSFVTHASEPWTAPHPKERKALRREIAQIPTGLPATRLRSLVRLTARMALLDHGDILVILGLGLAGALAHALRRRRPGLLLALLPALAVALASLVIFSARRHVSVLLPLGLTGSAALLELLPAGRLRGALALLVVPVLVGGTWGDTRQALVELQAQAAHARPAARLGRRLRTELPQDARLCGTSGAAITGDAGVLLETSQLAGCRAAGDLPAAPQGEPWLMAARLMPDTDDLAPTEVIIDQEGELRIAWPLPGLVLAERRRRAGLAPPQHYVLIPPGLPEGRP